MPSVYEFENQNVGYGLFESELSKIKIITNPINPQICLVANNSFIVQCDFQYLSLWVTKYRISKIHFKLIHLLYKIKKSKSHTIFSNSILSLNFPLNWVNQILFRKINIKAFKNYIFSNQLFSVYDKELNCYQNYVDCKQIVDNPAPAIGSSKLVYIYRDNIIHEKILKLY